MNPLVSVIIPTYNCESYIGRAIDSVLAQTYQNIEIIVVDDGSTDKTGEFLARYGRKIKAFRQKNSGPSSARNTGIRQSKGDWMAFLDSDDCWMADKLEKQLHVISDSPSVKFVNCSALLVDPERALRRPLIRSNLPRKKLIRELYLHNAVGGPPGWLISKECFQEIGLFDESLKVGEDWDLGLRICRRYDYFALPDILLHIVVRKGSQSSSARRNLENELVLLNKMFSHLHGSRHFLLKRKALSYRYRAAAIAFREEADEKSAMKAALTSIFCWPHFSKTTCATIIRSFRGLMYR